jgi:hypothetical protein
VIFHKQRREDRSTIAVEARFVVDDYERTAMLLNASPHGVMAALKRPPKRGTRVRLIIGDLVMIGQVRWSGSDCCGIALRDPISVADILVGRRVRTASIPKPHALRGLSGMLRSLVSDYRLS